MTQLRHVIAEELRKIWHTLSANVEDDMDDFANMLFEKDIITRGARKSKDFNTMMDVFISTMDTFKSVEEYKEHCSALLMILDHIGGGARRTSHHLKESWKTVMRDTVMTNFSL